jgi:predicted nucleic-acid-binding protein
MEILQEQTEKMVNMFLEQAHWFPAEGKEAVNEWLKTYNKGREAFKDERQ